MKWLKNAKNVGYSEQYFALDHVMPKDPKHLTAFAHAAERMKMEAVAKAAFAKLGEGSKEPQEAEEQKTSSKEEEKAPDAIIKDGKVGVPVVAKEQEPERSELVDQDTKAREEAKRRGYTFPPAWTNVWVNPDPEADLQVKGTDTKGRTQHVYSLNYRTQQDAKKFERLKEFTKALPAIMEKVEADLAEKDEAKVLYLIAQTGFRLGSTKDTGADVQAYGAKRFDHTKPKPSNDC